MKTLPFYKEKRQEHKSIATFVTEFIDHVYLPRFLVEQQRFEATYHFWPCSTKTEFLAKWNKGESNGEYWGEADRFYCYFLLQATSAFFLGSHRLGWKVAIFLWFLLTSWLAYRQKLVSVRFCTLYYTFPYYSCMKVALKASVWSTYIYEKRLYTQHVSAFVKIDAWL